MVELLKICDSVETIKSGELGEYRDKVKCIYIDPPYNTLTTKSYNDSVGQDEWEAMMRTVLTESAKLLTDDGVIFISIDDSEYAALKILGDEVFGKKNFVGTFITHQSQRSNSKLINIVHEYVVCFAKNRDKTKPFRVRRLSTEQSGWILQLCKKVKYTEKERRTAVLREEIKRITGELGITWLRNYSSVDDDGNIYFGKDLSVPSKPSPLDVPEIGLHLDALPTRGWSSPQKFLQLHKENRLVFKAGRPYEKHLLIEAEDNAPSMLNFYSRQGTKDLERIGLKDAFDTPKPLELIKYLLRLACEDGDLVMDFFGGSGTTAVAAHELGLQWVVFQREERIAERTAQYKAVQALGLEPVISNVTVERLNRTIGSGNYEIQRGKN